MVGTNRSGHYNLVFGKDIEEFRKSQDFLLRCSLCWGETSKQVQLMQHGVTPVLYPGFYHDSFDN